MSDVSEVECGDIIKTPFGVMIVEKIKGKGDFVGHQLTKLCCFFTRDDSVEVLNSDFRYKVGCGSAKEKEEEKK